MDPPWIRTIVNLLKGMRNPPASSYALPIFDIAIMYLLSSSLDLPTDYFPNQLSSFGSSFYPWYVGLTLVLFVLILTIYLHLLVIEKGTIYISFVYILFKYSSIEELFHFMIPNFDWHYIHSRSTHMGVLYCQWLIMKDQLDKNLRKIRLQRFPNFLQIYPAYNLKL
jgi:hypothetical protein